MRHKIFHINIVNIKQISAVGATKSIKTQTFHNFETLMESIQGHTYTESAKLQKTLN